MQEIDAIAAAEKQARAICEQAKVQAADLRGGAALVVAALGAEGVSRVSGLSHIRRGYQGLDDSLSALGADIRPRL